jgi:hypothetical protein
MAAAAPPQLPLQLTHKHGEISSKVILQVTGMIIS